MGVGHDLERKCGEGRIIVGVTLDRITRPGMDALHGRKVDGRRQVVHDSVQEGLHALVLEGGPGQDRHAEAREGAGTDGGTHVGGGDLLVAHELLEDVLIELGEHVDQPGPELLGLLHQVLGNVHDVPGGTQVLALPDEGVHLDQVHDADELGLGTDGQLDHRRVAAEPILDGVQHVVEVGTGAIHLVDEAHPGHLVLVGLAPHRLGLGLHSGHAVEHGHGAIQHPQRTLHLDREVHVARRVDDVDAVVPPEAAGGRGGDGDAPLLLLLHPVHGGSAVVDLTDLVVDTGVVEDPLGRSRLARVDMGHDPDVPGPLEWVSLCHGITRRSLFVRNRCRWTFRAAGSGRTAEPATGAGRQDRRARLPGSGGGVPGGAAHHR